MPHASTGGTPGNLTDQTLLLITASEPLLAEEALQNVQSKLARILDLESALESFRAGEDSMEAVLSAAETLPFGSERRVVLLRDAERLKDTEITQLQEYVRDPVPTSLLLLVAVGLDRRSKLIKAFQREQIISVRPLKGDSLRRWARSRFRERDTLVTDRALSFILENAGGSLSELDNVAEKLSLYYTGLRELDLDDVVPLVAPAAEADIYQLPDRICAGDTGAALKTLRRLFRQEEDALRILFVLVSHFRNLLGVKALREAGRRRAEIQSLLKLDDWRYQRLVPYLRKYDLPQLIDIYHQLMQADMDLKTGVYDGELALEMLVARITAKK